MTRPRRDGRSTPRPEHLAPLFVMLSAATDPTAPSAQVTDGYWMGLAKRSRQAA